MLIEPAADNGIFGEYPLLDRDTDREFETVINILGKGKISREIYDDEVLLTVNSFIYLSEQEFYDWVPFHRVIQDFMTLTGDPSGTGSGGPGYSFAGVADKGLGFARPGLLVMANSGRATNDSQILLRFQ